jgi:hypothetical protein
VPAAVTDDDGMLGRDLIEIPHVERALVLQLGVVVEVALDPGTGRQVARARLELVDDGSGS